MKLQEHLADSLHTITGYGDGWIAVNAVRYPGSLLVMPEGLLESWGATQLEDLDSQALAAISRHRPDLVLLGTGASQRFLHPRLASQITAHGVGLECMATAAACRTYNILMAEGRKVLAALLPIPAAAAFSRTASPSTPLSTGTSTSLSSPRSTAPSTALPSPLQPRQGANAP